MTYIFPWQERFLLFCGVINCSHALNAICLPHKNATVFSDNSVAQHSLQTASKKETWLAPKKKTRNKKKRNKNEAKTKNSLTGRGLGEWERARNKNRVTWPNVTSDILNHTQAPIQCVWTSFLAYFASSAGKKNTSSFPLGKLFPSRNR